MTRSAKVAYPNGDTFEGAFNEALQKHGRGTYTWSTAVGANPWVPEEGFPGAQTRAAAARARRALASHASRPATRAPPLPSHRPRQRARRRR